MLHSNCVAKPRPLHFLWRKTQLKLGRILIYVNKHAVWTALSAVVRKVPKHKHIFVLRDAYICTGRREDGEVGSKDNKTFGVYDQDTLNDNGESLLTFATNHDLALVKTFFSTPKGVAFNILSTSETKTCRLHPNETA